jgi:hypothetical protein
MSSSRHGSVGEMYANQLCSHQNELDGSLLIDRSKSVMSLVLTDTYLEP